MNEQYRTTGFAAEQSLTDNSQVQDLILMLTGFVSWNYNGSIHVQWK